MVITWLKRKHTVDVENPQHYEWESMSASLHWKTGFSGENPQNCLFPFGILGNLKWCLDKTRLLKYDEARSSKAFYKKKKIGWWNGKRQPIPDSLFLHDEVTNATERFKIDGKRIERSGKGINYSSKTKPRIKWFSKSKKKKLKNINKHDVKARTITNHPNEFNSTHKIKKTLL